MTKKVGLSISLCVKEILEGKVRLGDVVGIIAGTKFASIDHCYENYSKVYWGKWPEEEIRLVLVTLWPYIIQPRFRGEQFMPVIYDEHWLDVKVWEE